MSDDSSFTFNGLDDLMSDLEKAVDDFPAVATVAMEKIGKGFKKEMRAYVKTSGIKLDASSTLMKGFYVAPVEGTGLDVHTYFSGETHRKNPHWHLIENGHVMVGHYTYKGRAISDPGHVYGQVEGIHAVDHVSVGFEKKMEEIARKAMDDVLKKSNL